MEECTSISKERPHESVSRVISSVLTGTPSEVREIHVSNRCTVFCPIINEFHPHAQSKHATNVSSFKECCCWLAEDEFSW